MLKCASDYAKKQFIDPVSVQFTPIALSVAVLQFFWWLTRFMVESDTAQHWWSQIFRCERRRRDVLNLLQSCLRQPLLPNATAAGSLPVSGPRAATVHFINKYAVILVLAPSIDPINNAYARLAIDFLSPRSFSPVRRLLW